MMKRLALFVSLILTLVSCEKVYESSIPRVPVFYEIFFHSAQGRILLAPGSIVVITRPELSEHSIGYGGLIVTHSISEQDTYYAYDLACPYEARRDIRLSIDPRTYDAVCPVCQSRFSLPYGSGAPTDGPARTPLTRYAVYTIPGGIRIAN